MSELTAYEKLANDSYFKSWSGKPYVEQVDGGSISIKRNFAYAVVEIKLDKKGNILTENLASNGLGFPGIELLLFNVFRKPNLLKEVRQHIHHALGD